MILDPDILIGEPIIDDDPIGDAILSAASRLRTNVEVTPAGLLDWCKTYLGHHFTRPYSALHKEIARDFTSASKQRGQWINYIAPRGAAKTTFLCLGIPLYCVCEGIEPYGIIASDTAKQAKKHLASIRDELVENEYIAEGYPDVFGEGPVWREDAIRTRNGLAIEPYGLDQGARGIKHRQHRPSYIVVDDPEKDDHIHSGLQRDRRRERFHKTILKAGDARTNVFLAGTALHRDCLVMNTAQRPGWKTRFYRALLSMPENMDLWHEWKDILCAPGDQDREKKASKYYHQHRKAMNAGAKLLWPAQIPLYKLMLEWASDRTSFESERQNNPVNPDTCEFPEDYFEYPGFWVDEFPKEFKRRIIALDPSKGKDAKKGDYSAICMCQQSRDGDLYMDFDLARRPTEKICRDLVRRYQAFGGELVKIEANMNQDLLEYPLREAMEAEGVTMPVDDIHNTAAKEIRIRKWGGLLCSRKIHFIRSNGSKITVDQLRDFPDADHDDGPDAGEMAFRTFIEPDPRAYWL